MLCGLLQPLRRDSEVHSVAPAVMINLGCVCIWDWHTDGWCILLSPLLPAAFWGKCRDVLQSRSSMARDSLPPSSSQPAGCGQKWHLQSQEDSPSTSSRAGGPKGFGVAGGRSPATSCRHAPPEAEMGFLHPAGGDVPFPSPRSRSGGSDATLKEESDLYTGLQLRGGES